MPVFRSLPIEDQYLHTEHKFVLPRAACFGLKLSFTHVSSNPREKKNQKPPRQHMTSVNKKALWFGTTDECFHFSYRVLRSTFQKMLTIACTA